MSNKPAALEPLSVLAESLAGSSKGSLCTQAAAGGPSTVTGSKANTTAWPFFWENCSNHQHPQPPRTKQEMTLNSIGFQLSWIMLVSADIPKAAKHRACALSAQAVRELLQAGPSCLNTVIIAGSYLLLITGGRQGAIWGDGTATHSARPSLASICSLPLQHRGALTANRCSYIFLKLGKKLLLLLFSLSFSVRCFTLTILSILVFLLCSLFPLFIQKTL